MKFKIYRNHAKSERKDLYSEFNKKFDAEKELERLSEIKRNKNITMTLECELEESDKDMINQVYGMLKERIIHPSGKFDNGGRWYAENDDLISCRTPSRAWPYSEMQACRTKKYVKAVAEKFKCETIEDLKKHV